MSPLNPLQRISQRGSRPGLGVSAGLAMLWLTGCGEFKADTAVLTARSASPMEGLDCAACHGYPLKDLNHDYHLNDAVGNRDLNGKITCLDCHSQSLRSVALVLLDSVFEKPDGEQWKTLENPDPAARTTPSLPDTVTYHIRSLPLVDVDTLRQNHPVAAPGRAGAKPAFQEFLTALAHMNDKVDVVFDPRISDTARFKGEPASYNPKQETCSAVACHPGEKPYSFGSVAKGLPILKDQREEEEP
jgi:hypothetical protein